MEEELENEKEIEYKKPKIKEIEIDGERIFISKSKLFGYKIVYPLKIDGKINWKHLITGGSWRNLFFLLLMILIIYGCINEYSTALKLANECLKINTSPINLFQLP